MITNNYGMGLEREIEQLTKLRDIAVGSEFEEDLINFLNVTISEMKVMLQKHTEG